MEFWGQEKAFAFSMQPLDVEQMAKEETDDQQARPWSSGSHHRLLTLLPQPP